MVWMTRGALANNVETSDTCEGWGFEALVGRSSLESVDVSKVGSFCLNLEKFSTHDALMILMSVIARMMVMMMNVGISMKMRNRNDDDDEEEDNDEDDDHEEKGDDVDDDDGGEDDDVGDDDVGDDDDDDDDDDVILG